LDVVSDGVLIVDLEGDTQLYNDRVASIWGLDGTVVEEDGEELWRNMAEKTATEDEFLEQVQYLLDTPEEEYTGEVVLQDGRTVGMHTKPHKEADEIVGRSFSFSVIDDNGDNGT
ncbi:MAG: hypothetical protein SVU32_00175, partial [Candidatus Nanohaloarchaea archaeon]|nr:hypothetical protein [Candidatus Nanohaloarchaea archaeon]